MYIILSGDSTKNFSLLLQFVVHEFSFKLLFIKFLFNQYFFFQIQVKDYLYVSKKISNVVALINIKVKKIFRQCN